MDAKQRFIADLDTVMQDLTQIELDHEMWSALNENLLHHPWAGEPGEMMHFISRAHFAAFGLGLRRQLDRDPGSVSLANLIARVAARQVVFRRSDFVALYSNTYPAQASHWAAIGDEEFSELARDNTTPIYPPSRAFRHLEFLLQRADGLRKFVNRAVAHRSRKTPEPLTIRQHERLLWVMQRLWEHYEWLATGATPRLGSGLLGDEWRGALTIPWAFDVARHRGLCTSIIQQ
jgi:hypothetical protein